MKTTHIIFALVIVLAQGGLCTEQVKDLLIIRGKRIYTYDTPALGKAFPNLKIPKFDIISTANYKGYNATWAVLRGQLYLIGLDGFVRSSRKLQWDEKILQGQQFPLKVTDWSGVVTRVSPVSVYDPNTDTFTCFDDVTTIVFEKGRVSKVEFDKRVPRTDSPESKTK